MLGWLQNCAMSRMGKSEAGTKKLHLILCEVAAFMDRFHLENVSFLEIGSAHGFDFCFSIRST
jgi:hypothetical protein